MCVSLTYSISCFGEKHLLNDCKCKVSFTVNLPSAFMFSCGGLRYVDGLLQSSTQVHSSLLNDLPNVFDPVLLVLDT